MQITIGCMANLNSVNSEEFFTFLVLNVTRHDDPMEEGVVISVIMLRIAYP